MKTDCLILWAVAAAAAWAAPAGAECVQVGKFPAKIVPEQAMVLTFPSKGEVSDLVLDTSRRVEKGTIVGVLDKAKTAEELEDMELQLNRERLNKRDELRKLENQREKMRFYLGLSKNERTYAKDIKPEEGLEISRAALKDIDERMELTQKELSTFERRRRNEFAAKNDPKTLRMPFTGRLQYHFNLPENPEEPFEYTQGSSRPFASVCDDSAFYISINVNSSELSLLPPENLSACVELPGGERLVGKFSNRRVEQGSASADMLVYFFRLPEEDHARAYDMLGTSSTAKLFYEMEEGVELIRKDALLLHPAASSCEDWAALVRAARPGYELVLVTDRYIVARKQPSAAQGS